MFLEDLMYWNYIIMIVFYIHYNEDLKCCLRLNCFCCYWFAVIDLQVQLLQILVQECRGEGYPNVFKTLGLRGEGDPIPTFAKNVGIGS